MDEKILYKASVIAILLGLGFLYFYTEELNLTAVATLDTIPVEEVVKVEGMIKRLSSQDKVLFIQLLGERVEEMDVVIFTDETMFLQEGNYIEVTGTVEEFKGKKEIIAHKVVVK